MNRIMAKIRDCMDKRKQLTRILDIPNVTEIYQSLREICYIVDGCQYDDTDVGCDYDCSAYDIIDNTNSLITINYTLYFIISVLLLLVSCYYFLII